MAEKTRPTVNGLTKEDYQSWRHHPATKAFLRYLADAKKDLELAAVERWLAGTLTLSTENEIRARILLLDEMAGLEFEAMAQFYDDIAVIDGDEQAKANEDTE